MNEFTPNQNSQSRLPNQDPERRTLASSGSETVEQLQYRSSNHLLGLFIVLRPLNQEAIYRLDM